jgi:hypothetical protein
MTLTAVIRTVAQALAAWLIGLAWVANAAAWLAEQGIALDETVLEAGIFTALLGGVTAAVNWAGRRWPWVNKVFSLGRSTDSATY